MTQLTQAQSDQITPEMDLVAKSEKRDPGFIREKVAQGKIVILSNLPHARVKPIGIGEGLSTKINSNIGSSPVTIKLAEEIEKLKISAKYGADTIMDLSTGGDLDEIRKKLLQASTVPMGSVPIYQVMKEQGSVAKATGDQMLEVIRKHVADGMSFVTIHAGITKESLAALEKSERVTGVVSRGGSFLCNWIKKTGKENPLYERFAEVLEILKKYDAVISLGDGLRPGCINDASDEAQFTELKILAELTQRAWKAGVQVIVEGPGHVPIDQIKKNVELQKKLCHGAPFYVLGPLVTDIAPGYDHITCAIGGALACSYGVDFLCYVTPAEHLRLPTIEDVREGVIAAKIAAHAADIAKGVPGTKERDLELSKARKSFDWEKQFKLSIDPEKARERRAESGFHGEACSMCGEFCSMK